MFETQLGTAVNELLAAAVRLLEGAWAAGGGMSVEKCLALHPEISTDPAAVMRLIELERRHRNARGESVPAEEYARRFPELRFYLVMSDEAAGGLHESNGGEEGPASERIADGPLTFRDNRFEWIERVGQGTEGCVWSALRRSTTFATPRPVAVKIFNTVADGAASGDPADGEVTILRDLHHPGIIRLHEAGRDEAARPFFTMEFSPLGSLDFYLGAPWAPKKAAMLVRDLARTVAYLHDTLALVHRDLKPSNVILQWLSPGPPPAWERPSGRSVDDITAGDVGSLYGENKNGISAKVSDFGFAVPNQPGGVSRRAVTPLYAAPEQLRGAEGAAIGPACDVWALGVIFYQLLTGRHPFFDPESTPPDRDEINARIIGDTVTTPRGIGSAVPPELEALCLGCLERDPEVRLQAAALFTDLDNYLSARPIKYRPPGRITRCRLAVRRNPGRALASIFSLLVLVCLTVAVAGVWMGVLARANEEAAVRATNKIDEVNKQLVAANAQLVTEQERGRETRDAFNKGQLDALLTQCELALQKEELAAATPTLNQAELRATQGEIGESDRARLVRCRADFNMLVELNRIDDRFWATIRGEPQFAAAATEWPMAFRRFGIAPGTTPLEEAARRIIESNIRGRLLAVADRWLTWQPALTTLKDVLHLADRDAYRDGLRNALVTSNATEIRKLAEQPQALEQPARFATALVVYGALPHRRQLEILLSSYRKDPRDFATLAWLGILSRETPTHTARARAHDPSESIGWYRAAIAARPNSIPAWVELGNALAARGDLQEAITCYNKAIGFDPNSALGFHNLGVALSLLGREDEAIEQFQKATDLDPHLAHAFFEWGVALFKKRDLKGAIEKYGKAVQLDSTFAPAFNNLANAQSLDGEPGKALKNYEKATQLDPKYALAFANFGNALAKNGDASAAIWSYKRAIALDPKDAPSHVPLISLLVAKGDLDGAIYYAMRLSKLPHPDALILLKLGASLVPGDPTRRDLDGAIRCFEVAVEVFPRPALALAYHNLGYVKFLKEDFDGAVRSLQTACAINPSLIEPQKLLAVVTKSKADQDRLPRGTQRAPLPRRLD